MLRTTTMTWSEATDEELIGGLAARDEDAVQALVDRYWARAHRVALHVTGDAAAAEDVAQDALVRALQAARRFERGASFRAWFFAIVKNAARDHLRRTSRRASHEGRARVGAVDAPARAVEQDEEAAAVRAHLAGLGADQREVLALHYLEGLTFAEVARVLGVPHGTVASRLGRGLESLRRSLSPTLAVNAIVLALEAPAPGAPAAIELLALADAALGDGSPGAPSAPSLLHAARRPARLAILGALTAAGLVGLGAATLLLGDAAPIADAPAGAAPDDGQATLAHTADVASATRAASAPAATGGANAGTGGSAEDGGAGAAAAPTAPGGADERTSRGVVLLDDRPLAGVVVRSVRGGRGLQGTTDPHGRFAMPLVEGEGPIELSVLVPHRAAAEGVNTSFGSAEHELRLLDERGAPGATSLEVEAERAMAGVALRVTATSVAGRVLRHEDDRPVEGARVLLLDRETTTDATGSFSLTAPLGEEAVVIAVAPGRATAAWTVIADEERPIVLRLRPAQARSIRVLAAGGAPLEGAEVTCFEDVSDRGGDPWTSRVKRKRTARTDVDGRTLLDGLQSAERVRVTVKAPGHALLRVDFEAKPDLPELELRLTAAHTLRGRVVGPDGPLAGALVASLGENGGSGGFSLRDGQVELGWHAKKTTTEVDGSFELALPEGPARLLVHADGLARQELVLTLPSADLEVRLSAGVTISGRVEGRDARELFVQAWTAAPDVNDYTERREPLAAAVIDAAGAFTLTGLPHGARVDLEVRDAALRERAGLVRGVATGSAGVAIPLDVRPRSAEVMVRAVDPLTGDPLALRNVKVHDEAGSGFSSSTRGATVTVQLEAEPERSVRLELRVDGRPPQLTPPVTIKPGARISLGDLPMPAGGGWLHVVVEGGQGADVLVELRERATGVVLEYDATGDHPARVSAIAAAGSYEVRVLTRDEETRASPWAAVDVLDGQSANVSFTAP